MRDKKIWIFNSGLSFDGNPKWLFLYIKKHRPEIKCWWFCYTDESADYIRKLGYNACLFNSKEAENIGSKAGVYVVNQRKEVFQPYLEGITVLNLWHGVGCKTVEKTINEGLLDQRISKKYIQNNNIYSKYELFLVTSPLMERHFIGQCNLTETNIVRGGYPCNENKDKVMTYDHDILKAKGLPADTKIAVYAPTYRDNYSTNFFELAVPNIEKLITTLKNNNMVLIMKMHPKMADIDFGYKNAMRLYSDCPQLIFWDNANDIYEIYDKIDLAVIDYSSIFYDMLAHGIKNFIRYLPDKKENMRDFALDYESHTCGTICKDFGSLLDTLSDYRNIDLSDELKRIDGLFWEYSHKYSLDDIIDRAIEFQPDENRILPTLYSFDIFDTLLGRSCLLPVGVFRYVQQKIVESGEGFPYYFSENYFKIRPWCESNAREYHNKSTLYRGTDTLEISFDQIFEHMKDVYELTDRQVQLLKEWELECEYKTSVPITENIDTVKELVNAGETVVLISDMYLPEEFIKKLLAKADPVLESLPLYLSSNSGYQKTTNKLFLEVYHSLDYIYGEWIHTGDNQKADINVPSTLGITPNKITARSFNGYEKALCNFTDTYDAYQVSNLFSRFRNDNPEATEAQLFAYCYAPMYFVPYVHWAIKHAIRNGTECLYFISRDGHHLKRIADIIIEKRGYKIKTKYIYGSRKAWQIPSQINEIDEEMWSEFGLLAGLNSFDEIIEAMRMTEEEFAKMFPELMYLKDEDMIIDKQVLNGLSEILSSSDEYKAYLLDFAKKQREPVEKYLKQEINFDEKYAFVEYWGRGYTQTCLSKLINNITGNEEENIFYYARSIYPSHGKVIRYNFTANNFSLIFIEAIFANLHYKTVSQYVETENGMEPIITPNDNNAELHEMMQEYLPKFTEDYMSLELENENDLERSLFDFGLSFFHRNPKHSVLFNCISTLKDSVASNGNPIEWAPPITWKDVFGKLKGKNIRTKNVDWSISRSSRSIKMSYNFYKKHLKGKKTMSTIKKVAKKLSGGNTKK